MNVLDLFSGIGGFSLGFERAGFKTVAFCEIDPFCQEVLKKHWPETPIYDDVREITKSRLVSDGIGRIDVVTGGFPCQDLSQAGHQKGINAERSGLYKENLRVVSDLMPEIAVFENVTELLIGDNGRWFAQFLYDLAEIGFDAEWHCIPASEFGAAHHRDRVWIIAYPNGTNVQGFKFPKPFCVNPEESRGRQHTRAINACLSADDYIEWRRNINELPQELGALKAYGNTVYPDITEYIGRAIMEGKKNA